ncbi:MAG: RNA polymerase factor sigma-32 [Deltaproteobacteria bacterium]|nr:RNA polymerase factor sigma-32 [Deltaproteobacteria bacterium]
MAATGTGKGGKRGGKRKVIDVGFVEGGSHPVEGDGEPGSGGGDGDGEAEPDLAELEPDAAELSAVEAELGAEPLADGADGVDGGAGGGDGADGATDGDGESRGLGAVRALGSVKGARSIVRHDPLSAYMSELRRYPLLTREEEHELAVKYVKTGDVVAARRLVTANLRLVVKIAHEYRRSYKNVLDLVQEGNLGLLQAVKKYDPYRGVKLSSYAAWWIRAYILKYVLSNWRLVKIGTTQAQRKLFFNLRKEREKLEREGYEVGPKLLAERLDVSEAEVNEMSVRLGAPDLSLDAPSGRGDDDNAHSPMDRMPSAAAGRPDRQVEGGEFRALLREKLEQFAKGLKGREETIFRERLLNDAPLTLQEIGEKYGISRERARQLEKRLVTRLRGYLEKELGEAVAIGASDEEP